MTKIHYTIAFIIFIGLASCEKSTEHEVEYRITESVSGFNVRYMDGAGQMFSEFITTQSAQDTWKYSFRSDEGGIVFVSANYKDPASALKVQITIDGKVYKQAASKNDTVSFITVSGIIPYSE
jgi:hypothetical protein